MTTVQHSTVKCALDTVTALIVSRVTKPDTIICPHFRAGGECDFIYLGDNDPRPVSTNQRQCLFLDSIREESKK